MQEIITSPQEYSARLTNQVRRAVAGGATYAAARRQVARRNHLRQRELNGALHPAVRSTAREWEDLY